MSNVTLVGILQIKETGVISSQCFVSAKKSAAVGTFLFFCTVVSFRLAVKETKDFFLKNEEGKKKYMLKVSSYNSFPLCSLCYDFLTV